jgi:hypothetical protein
MLFAKSSGSVRQRAQNLFFLACALIPGISSAEKRCDWHGPKSNGETTYKKCIDYAAMNGKTLVLPTNVTRISQDGISFCPGIFTVTGAGNADIVFIYDNSGSMQADGAWVNPTTKDTTFYYNDSNTPACFQNPRNGNITYQTLTGPRTIPLFQTNTGCVHQSGDPYYARGEVIKNALDFLGATSPTSTAGSVGFTSTTTNPQTPVQMNTNGNINQIKSKIILGTTGGTDYRPPLELAKSWLNYPKYIKTQRQAIVFISDGAPNNDSYLNLVDAKMPPIFSVYLSKAVTADTAKLKSLSDNTGGTFTRVNSNDPSALEKVLKGIVESITKNSLPKSLTVTNSSMAPPQTSVSASMTVNPDGSSGIVLDSIIGLKLGANQINFHVIRLDSVAVDYNFTLDVSGAAIGGSQGNFSCYDMPTMVALENGKVAEIYNPVTAGTYDLKLVRSPSDLKGVAVAAVSDAGDQERIGMPTANSSTGYPTHIAPFNVNPNDGSPAVGNGTLEVTNKGLLTFTWSHPRDDRENVTYILPGRKIPVLDGVVGIVIKDPVTVGGDIIINGVKIVGPLVIRDIKGVCIVNCTGTQVIVDKNNLPTWMVTVRSPFKYSFNVYDNLGQYVNKSFGEITLAQWDKLARDGDSTVLVMSFLPVADNGRQIGTGAYVMKSIITTQGGQVTKDFRGDPIVVKSSRKEYFQRFGYRRN